MTKKQYEEIVKTIMETATMLMKVATSDEEKIHILMTQNMQIASITEEFYRNNNH